MEWMFKGFVLQKKQIFNKMKKIGTIKCQKTYSTHIKFKIKYQHNPYPNSKKKKKQKSKIKTNKIILFKFIKWWK